MTSEEPVRNPERLPADLSQQPIRRHRRADVRRVRRRHHRWYKRLARAIVPDLLRVRSGTILIVLVLIVLSVLAAQCIANQ